ncbi:zinc ribbon domain-containing protein [Brevundimonas vancanneytii]|uniref:zinc ribbon domain-containing protein n=1 Tax=Brevundimonas vancanneytii TaxID=1325724 RepID=UPI0034D5FF8B
MEVFLFLLLFWALMAFIPAAIAEKKGRDKGPWWLYGFLVWPIATIHALVMSPSVEALEARTNQQAAAAGNLRCPHCAEWIKREARVCRYCGRDVE